MLPIADSAFEAAIREGGKAVDTNLAAFAFGRGHAKGELEQTVRAHRKRAAAAAGIEDLIQRARSKFPAASLDIVEEGVRRLVSYQDHGYAKLFLDRLEPIRPEHRHLQSASRFSPPGRLRLPLWLLPTLVKLSRAAPDLYLECRL